MENAGKPFFKCLLQHISIFQQSLYSRHLYSRLERCCGIHGVKSVEETQDAISHCFMSCSPMMSYCGGRAANSPTIHHITPSINHPFLDMLMVISFLLWALLCLAGGEARNRRPRKPCLFHPLTLGIGKSI